MAGKEATGTATATEWGGTTPTEGVGVGAEGTLRLRKGEGPARA